MIICQYPPTSKLEIYQRAILHFGQTPVTSLVENTEARRLCDLHYEPVLQALRILDARQHGCNQEILVELARHDGGQIQTLALGVCGSRGGGALLQLLAQPPRVEWRIDVIRLLA